jgi:hypothetical protein
MGYDIINKGAFDSVTVKTGDATNSIAERQSGANRSAKTGLDFNVRLLWLRKPGRPTVVNQT